MAVGFHEVQFPPDISYGVTGGPKYSTSIVTTKAGYEQRNIDWSQARAEYQAAHGVKTAEQMRRLIAFFRARRGKAYGFRFKDWADFKAVGQYIATGDGVTKTFQLKKVYVDEAGFTEERVIKKPVEHTVVVYVNNYMVTTGFTVDYTTGKITFATPLAIGDTLHADFEFDVPVRFDTDHMPVNIKEWNDYTWDSIPIVEIKLP